MRWQACLVALALSACGQLPHPQSIGSARQALLTEVTNFGPNPDSLRMFVYVPSNMPATPAPLVVSIHGCFMDATDHQATGWNAIADRNKFYLVYPQIDGNYGCMHWFDSSETARGSGEVRAIKQMVDHMKATYPVDSARVYVTGLSSGGAMAAAMMAAYPDVFEAGAPLAGIPVGCSTSCMTFAESNTAQEWGDAVRAVYPGYSGRYPRVSIWQGKEDSVVSFANFGELISQWTNVQGVDAISDATETIGVGTHREYRDGQGKTRVESWELAGMDHGAPVDPDISCGSADTYMLDVGICSAERIAKFFGILAVAGPDAGRPGLDASAPGLDASEAGPDACVDPPDADAEPCADAGRDAGRRDAGYRPVDPGQCNCGVSAGAPESILALLLLAGLLRSAARQ